jgi:hypoxanthine phosphoribosyltransferase
VDKHSVNKHSVNKRYIQEQELLEDSFRLAVKIYESGYRPNFIVGVWRGGSTVGIYVQECLQYLGIETDHIAIRTSYRGMNDYLKQLESDNEIRAHGLQYLFENMNATDNLLIVDDVYGTGRNVAAVVNRLQAKTKRNMPKEVRVAVPYYKPQLNQKHSPPDYYLHEYDEWLVLPYELTGLSEAEIHQNKAWIKPILDSLVENSLTKNE